MRPFCLEVTGDYACFTRPEMKVERVSYDVITPSAARAIFEAVLWKPGIRWRIRKIEVLNPVRWIAVRRNEVGKVASTRNAIEAMNGGEATPGIIVEDERQQRAGLFLRDVRYRLHADLELVSEEAKSEPNKFMAMFVRRAQSGQCVNQPYLGCREFAAQFRLIELVEDGKGGFRAPSDEPEALHDMNEDLGWVLYDLDFSGSTPMPKFFRAQVKHGEIDLIRADVRG
jgi:CRISPR-associated protein Cas5d